MFSRQRVVCFAPILIETAFNRIARRRASARARMPLIEQRYETGWPRDSRHRRISPSSLPRWIRASALRLRKHFRVVQKPVSTETSSVGYKIPTTTPREARPNRHCWKLGIQNRMIFEVTKYTSLNTAASSQKPVARDAPREFLTLRIHSWQRSSL